MPLLDSRVAVARSKGCCVQKVGIALMGCGTVGSAVAHHLIEHADSIAQRVGRPIELRHLLIRELQKPRAGAIPKNLFTTTPQPLWEDPQVQVIIELMGGVEPAFTYIQSCLQAGKDVITANKALLARHGEALFSLARQHHRVICFEAAVAGGIPLIRALTQGLAANRIQSIKAILNGTSNFILSEMTENQWSYAQALQAAQAHGFAEADPALDVNGTDAAQKLSILARLAFNALIHDEDIEWRGIAGIDQSDLQFAGEMDCVIKLLAEAWLSEGRLALHVEPTLIRRHEPLAEVRGPYNAAEIVGDIVGHTFFYGLGAGAQPTASAVLSDLIDLVHGSAAQHFLHAEWNRPAERLPRCSPHEIQSRFYLRLNVLEKTGVLAEVDGILAKHGIGIASVVQHEEREHARVPLVIMTHNAILGAFRLAVRELQDLPCVADPPIYYPIAE